MTTGKVRKARQCFPGGLHRIIHSSHKFFTISSAARTELEQTYTLLGDPKFLSVSIEAGIVHCGLPAFADGSQLGMGFVRH